MFAILAPHQIDLIGTIPRPSGGVSQHVWRLAMRLAGLGCRVLDLSPDSDKYPMPQVAHECSPRSWMLKAPWLNHKINRSSASIAHYHFSTTKAVSYGAWWMSARRRGQLRVLTLHHGQLLERHRRLNPAARRLAEASIRRFDRIIVLSMAQHEFYMNVARVPVERLVRATSHIRLPNATFIRQQAMARAKSSGEKPGLTFIASGGIAPYYRHEDAVRLVKQMRRRCDARLTLCLYGPRNDQAYLRELQELTQDLPFVTLRFDLDLPEFVQILAVADLYLRPNTVDSYGLAVADAISLGVPAIASDVCDRCPGAVLFPAGNYEAFEQVAEQVINDLPRLRAKIAQQPPVDSFSTYLHAYGFSSHAAPDWIARAA